jgi:tryptophanyl-tRNA synthetase
MTDDEKFLVKDLTLAECQRFAIENSKDIIAAGFNPEKTFIFADSKYFGTMYETVLKVQKLINYNQARAVFGFCESDPIGKIAFPPTQIAPCFSEAFPHIFKGRTDVPCLIPYAIDQDPYFRLCRDIAPRLKLQKPASICSKFFPALQGNSTKMSASSENTAIFMTDTPAQIKKKINSHAFSGGGETVEVHRTNGANLAVDIPFQYLRFFMESDEELIRVAEEYSSGRMLTGEVKALCIKVLQEFVGEFQKRRADVTDEIVKQFMSVPPTPREAALMQEIAALKASK